jgi:O-methyltransferase
MAYFKPGGSFFGITLPNKKTADIWQSFFQTINPNLATSNVFASDNLITFNKTLGFLKDEKFVNIATEVLEGDQLQQSIIWRIHTLCWAAAHCRHVHGDFVELGCYNGKTSRLVAEYVQFQTLGKTFYLYDVFDSPPDSDKMPQHSGTLHDDVVERFKPLSNVVITKGVVPETLDLACPEHIAYMHIDMNNTKAEMGALERLFDRVTPGGIIVFDDYGWAAYQDQYNAEKAFMCSRGYEILELPTGQGVLFKR